MARKRDTTEQIIGLLRQSEVMVGRGHTRTPGFKSEGPSSKDLGLRLYAETSW